MRQPERLPEFIWYAEVGMGVGWSGVCVDAAARL